MIQVYLSGLVSCGPICQYSTICLFFQHLRHTSLSPASESCNYSSFISSLYGSFILEFRSLLDETFFDHPMYHLGFPHSSGGKESACNAGDPGSIPGSGRSPGEGIGYPLQYSWASLVVQLVKTLPIMQETWVWSLGWEDPLEKG